MVIASNLRFQFSFKPITRLLAVFGCRLAAGNKNLFTAWAARVCGLDLLPSTTGSRSQSFRILERSKPIFVLPLLRHHSTRFSAKLFTIDSERVSPRREPGIV